jgi:hypothetical protein
MSVLATVDGSPESLAVISALESLAPNMRLHVRLLMVAERPKATPSRSSLARAPFSGVPATPGGVMVPSVGRTRGRAGPKATTRPCSGRSMKGAPSWSPSRSAARSRHSDRRGGLNRRRCRQGNHQLRQSGEVRLDRHGDAWSRQSKQLGARKRRFGRRQVGYSARAADPPFESPGKSIALERAVGRAPTAATRSRTVTRSVLKDLR